MAAPVNRRRCVANARDLHVACRSRQSRKAWGGRHCATPRVPVTTCREPARRPLRAALAPPSPPRPPTPLSQAAAGWGLRGLTMRAARRWVRPRSRRAFTLLSPRRSSPPEEVIFPSDVSGSTSPPLWEPPRRLAVARRAHGAPPTNPIFRGKACGARASAVSTPCTTALSSHEAFASMVEIITSCRA